MIKERETRERTKESKEKESPTSACACRARVRESLPPIIDVKEPPSLGLLLAFAHLRCQFFDDDFTREWFRIMSEELMWRYPETGEPIKHWPAYFRLWRANRAYFDALRDPERIPDARKGGSRGGSPRKSDNWRGTKREEIGNVLG